MPYRTIYHLTNTSLCQITRNKNANNTSELFIEIYHEIFIKFTPISILAIHIGLTPALSIVAICSQIFHSCIFHPGNFARIAFSTPAFSVSLLKVIIIESLWSVMKNC